MEIKTKYNIGDTVHFMYQNQSYKAQIHGIELRQTANLPLEIKYDIAGMNVPKMYEHKIFTSKEELIKSL